MTPREEPGFVESLAKRESIGPNASIWLNLPMLGNVSSQSYWGRVVVEVWENGESSFHTTYMDQPRKTAFLLEKAMRALQNANTPVLTTTPWSNEPLGVMPGQSLQAFQGRVVVEVWDDQATVAITGTDEQSDLAKRAVQKIIQMIRMIH